MNGTSSIISAFDDFLSLSRFSLWLIGLSYAAVGGLKYFNLIAKQIKCFHMYFLRKYGQVHLLCFQFSDIFSSFGKVITQIARAPSLNWSNVFQSIPSYNIKQFKWSLFISSSFAILSFLDGQ